MKRLFILVAQAGDVVADVFEDVREPLDAVKNIKHPEGIKKQKQDDNGGIDRLRHDGAFQSRCFRDLVVRVDDVEHIDEPEQEDHEQDDLEEHEIKMAHQPFRCQVIPVPDLVHQVVQAHNNAP